MGSDWATLTPANDVVGTESLREDPDVAGLLPQARAALPARPAVETSMIPSLPSPNRP
jgi:hypothetical protein